VKSVGLRELKNRLSEYIREARSGESVLVTDRGEVVAELVAASGAAPEGGIPAAVAALARKGELTLGEPNLAALYTKLPPLLKRRRTAELLEEERGSR
jgi:prevent-host-death family protein